MRKSESTDPTEQSNSDFQVRTFFPAAMRQKDVEFGAIQISRQLGLTGTNTLFAHSCCPDEINHANGDITTQLREHFGGAFALGGLAGIPFTGATGFGAMASHGPDDGNIFVLFAPHCAVSKQGECGKYHRPSQKGESHACGAAIGALNAVKDLDEAPQIDPLGIDCQMQIIKNLVWKHKDQLNASEQQIRDTTYILYEESLSFIRQFANKNKFPKINKIVILGGI